VLKTPHIAMVTGIAEPKSLLWALPLAVTSFGFHGLIPSLKSYVQGSRRRLCGVIVLGSFIPLVVYACWEWSILSIIPVPDLMAMLDQPGNPAELLIQAFAKDHSLISIIVGCFAFCALVSSMIGVALSLFDFLADGCHIVKTGKGRYGLLALIFLPTIIIALWAPQGFLAALNYAGVFAAILLILYPVAMVWSGRYIRRSWGPEHYLLPGGKGVLIGLFIFGLTVILVEVLH
jgi:tyrosine-specific transport protein